MRFATRRLSHGGRRTLHPHVPAEERPAFVLGVGPNGLSFLRSLGRRRIPVFALDTWMRPGMHSRYARPFVVPDPADDKAALLRSLQNLGTAVRGRAALLATTDAFALFASRSRDGLEPTFDFNLADHNLIHSLTNKRLQYERVRRQGVPLPLTLDPQRESIEEIAREMPFPCLLKPSESHRWRAYLSARRITGWGKVVEVASPQALIETYREMRHSGLEVLVQEKIPGGDDQLYGLLAYLDRDSEPLAVFTKRKLRQFPRGYGNGSLQISVREPEVLRLGLRLLQGLRFRGLAGVEFKRDPRDERLKLIEVNPRSISQTYHAVACGVDIPYIAYRDTGRERVEKALAFREGVKWISLERDLQAFLEYRRSRDLEIAAWLRSWTGDRCFAYFSADDPLPSVVNTSRFFLELARRTDGRRTSRYATRGTAFPRLLRAAAGSAEHSRRPP